MKRNQPTPAQVRQSERERRARKLARDAKVKAARR